jgi:hypothetical protein
VSLISDVAVTVNGGIDTALRLPLRGLRGVILFPSASEHVGIVTDAGALQQLKQRTRQCGYAPQIVESYEKIKQIFLSN